MWNKLSAVLLSLANWRCSHLMYYSYRKLSTFIEYYVEKSVSPIWENLQLESIENWAIKLTYFIDGGNIGSDGSSGSLHHSQHGPQPGTKYLFVLELNHHRPVFGTGGRFRLLQNGTLVIRNVGETDEGSYLCEADNGVNEPLGKVVKLKVNGK